MKVYLYCHVWNEACILPYFLRHYAPLVDWMFFYDQDSDDGTRDIIRNHPRTTLLSQGVTGMLDWHYIKLAEDYKVARGCADWVLWPDADEFLYHPNLRKVLERYLVEGIEAPRVKGYQMISPIFPTTNSQIYDEVKCGYPSNVFDKPIIFRPEVDMHWKPGKHSLIPPCDPRRSQVAEIKLLHFRFIDPDYVAERNARNWERMDYAHRKAGCNWTCDPKSRAEHSTYWYLTIRDKQFPKVI